MKKTRAGQAGMKLGEAIVEMVNLMYQDKTAMNFLTKLHAVITRALYKRMYGNDAPLPLEWKI